MSTDTADSGERGPFSFLPGPALPGTGGRRGTLRTPHGSVETPVFMPVGTAATVKGLDPGTLRATGTRMVLANTYHLGLRPGTRVIKDLGGLHAFMRWDGPLLTDSGGYQVFSLQGLTEVDRDGVTFRNHLDGRYLRFTPESVMQMQVDLGADVLMAFDECLPLPAARDLVKRSLAERTLPWAERCLRQHPRDGRALFAVGQGGLDPGLRRSCLQALSALGFDGYAIGGLSVGETSGEMLEVVRLSTRSVPWDRPRYLMGVGSPPEILEAVDAGVDMFDCVLPTRNARNASALTFDGSIRLRNARFTRDAEVLEPGCPCPACAQGFSRAYLRHLLMAREILGAVLMTAHNLTFMQRLMAGVREALDAGTFPPWSGDLVRRWRARGDGTPAG